MKSGNLEDSYRVNLLVNLLVKYPEIFTINYNLASSSYCITYMVIGEAKGEGYQQFRRQLQQNLAAFYYFQKREPSRVGVCKKNLGGLTKIEVSVYGERLSTEETSLINNYMREFFKEALITEFRQEEADAEDVNPWEDFLEFMLVRSDHLEENLFAFRDAGKVYVFDK